MSDSTTVPLALRHPCRECGERMKAAAFTKKRRLILGPGGWEYGVAWRCWLCSHQCWTRVTKRDWLKLGGGQREGV